MDILSHGLWGAIAFGRKSRANFWLAFVIGLAPDLFSFGILGVAGMLGLSETRLQSWHTTGIIDPAVCPSSL